MRPLDNFWATSSADRHKALPEGARLTNIKRLADRYLTDANWAKVEKLTEFANSRGHQLLELAFAWLLARPGVASVIAGATKPEQLEQNVHAVAWKLTADELQEIDKITGAAS